MSSSTIGVVAAVLVALVLLVAGISKISAPAAWKSQAAGLRVPVVVAAAVPFVEVALGAALLVQLHRHLIAWSSVVLFTSFSVLLIVRLAAGEHPPCACFGSITAKPIGSAHLVRNAVLIAIAILAATL